MLPNLNSKIYIAGHKGMVGSACWRILSQSGYSNLIGQTSKELDLRHQQSVSSFISENKPDIIIDAAAKVGGIWANDSYPYQFLMDNLQIQNNLISAALQCNVDKFIFLGSSCIYPKHSSQPITENSLLSGSLESTNEWYAIAKIAGLKLCQAIRQQYGKDFVSLMPTNLYGPNDNFDLETSHVLPALIRKFHEAKKNNNTVTLWGTGDPLREFLHVDDLAHAVKFALENNMTEALYNVGSSQELSIKELAHLIQKEIGHKGEVIWDKSKPNGTMRKLIDSSKIRKLGWKPKYTIQEGLSQTYNWFIENQHSFKETKF